MWCVDSVVRSCVRVVAAWRARSDFDAVWDPTGVDTDILDPIFFDLADARRAQKARFGGELLPDMTEAGSGLRFAEFFQRDRSGQAKGIILLELKATNS